MLQEIKDTATELTENLGDAMAQRRTEKQLRDLKLGQVAMGLQLTKLDRRVAASQRGFPWGLVLLAGVGYLIVNKPARERALGLLGQVSPSARDAVQQVVGRVGGAVEDVKGGKDPREAAMDTAKTIGQDLKQAAPDIGREVQQKAGEVKDQAQQAVSQVKDQAQQAASQVKDQAQQAAGEVKDQAKDKAQQAGQAAGQTGQPSGSAQSTAQQGKDLAKEQVPTQAQGQKPGGR